MAALTSSQRVSEMCQDLGCGLPLQQAGEDVLSVTRVPLILPGLQQMQ